MRAATSCASAATGGYVPSSVELTLVGGSNSVFASDALPTALALENFSYAAVKITFANGGGDGAMVVAPLDSLAVLPAAGGAHERGDRRLAVPASCATKGRVVVP